VSDSVPLADILAQAIGHHHAGRLAEAETLYRAILDRMPAQPESNHNLGMLLAVSGRAEAALPHFQSALEADPAQGQFWISYAELLLHLGRSEDCLGLLVEGIRRGLAGQTVDALIGRARLVVATAHHQAGRLTEAVAEYHQVLKTDPDDIRVLSNLGFALRTLGRFDEAEPHARRAVEIDPGDVTAQFNLGCLLYDASRMAEAEARFRLVLDLDPSHVDALTNLARVQQDQGRIDDAVECQERAVGLRPDSAFLHSNLLFSLCFKTDADPDSVFRRHRDFDLAHTAHLMSPAPHSGSRDPDRRLRIGYLSPDFRLHPGGHFILTMLEHHDPAQVEVFCYHASTISDWITDLFRRRADHWLECEGLSDEALAGRIRADGIDILVECCGHMENTRLAVCAYKPAPVQVSFPLYPNTTGMAAMDYRVMDRYFAPAWADAWHSEKLIRMPDAHVCYRPSYPHIEPPGQAPCIANGHVTFGSFNNFAKIGQATLAAWAEILARVPTSRLLLKWRGLEAGGGQWCADRMAAHGIGRDRLLLVDYSPDPYTPYRRMDIALDTIGANGGTTTCDALWMGVPVVSQAGRTPFSRVGYCHLTNVGLAELVAHDTEAYVATAVALATDRDRLVALRQGLRERFAASPLMDGGRYTRNLERAFRIVWRRWCSGQPARALDLSDHEAGRLA
jgi:protein O-GlcNAc transferase